MKIHYGDSLGSIGFYEAALLNGNTYREMAIVNILQICPRDGSQAQKRVRLTDITTKDIICWHTRTVDTLLEVEDPNIREEKRPGFDRRHPEAYEVSWVQVNKKRRYEKTRQAICMFCQTAPLPRVLLWAVQRVAFLICRHLTWGPSNGVKPNQNFQSETVMRKSVVTLGRLSN